MLKYDISIQFRSGYWTVYGVIGLIYLLVIVNLPYNIRDDAAVVLIFTDTSALGLIFVGALVLLEKQQGILQSLSVTPLKINNYLFSKVLSLTLLSAIISSILWIVPRWTFHGYALLLAGAVLSSIVFTMFGIGFSAGAESFNQFIARVLAGSMILTFPLIPMLFIQKTTWLIFLPMNAAIDLYIRLLKGTFSVTQLLDLLVLIIWIFIMRIFAQKQFQKHNLFI